MTITLINCNNKFIEKGINVHSNGWQEKLTESLQTYVSVLDGWSYDFENDTLKISVPGTENVPANIVDFGTGKSVELDA